MENRNHKFRRQQFLTVDRWLIRLATMAVVLLLIVQTLLLSSDARKYLSLVDKLEGDQITSPAIMYAADSPWPNPAKEMNVVNKVVTRSIRTLRPSQNITIRMINPPASDDAIVTVNGETGGRFGKGNVELTVYDGDYVEIDAAKIKTPVQFIIDTHQGNIVNPVDGIMLESKNNVIVVGKVVFKH